MRAFPRRLALPLAAALLAAGPALARGTHAFHDNRVQLELEQPGPLLDRALQGLAAGDLQAAELNVELAQGRLLFDSNARDLPSNLSREAMRNAIPVLDRARQAITAGNRSAADAAIREARRML